MSLISGELVHKYIKGVTVMSERKSKEWEMLVVEEIFGFVEAF